MRALLVDLSGTLFSEEPMDRRAAAEALAAEPRFAPHLPDADALEAQLLTGAQAAAWTVLGWLEARLLRGFAAEAEDLVWDRAVRMTPMPGAREALAALREANIPIGVVSNTRFSGRAWRRGLDLKGLAVDFVVSSADVKARKPDRAIFLAALERLNVPAADVWFVGDSLERDVSGAAAAGMRPFWFGAPAAPRPLTPCRDWFQFLELWKVSSPGGVP